MPYEVGNLQIVFEAVDKTSKSFESLAKNLNSVKKSISQIGSLGDSDLKAFEDRLTSITTAFTPLLDRISGASAGLTAFNEVTRLSANRISEVANEFENVSNVVQNLNNSTQNLNENLNSGARSLTEEYKKTLAQLQNLSALNDKITREKTPKHALIVEMQNTQIAIDEATKKLNKLKEDYSSIFGGGLFGNIDLAQKTANEIATTEQAIEQLKTKLTELKSAFGSPFNAAQSAISQLKKELLDTTFVTGQVNQDIVNQIKQMQVGVDNAAKQVNAALADPLTPLQQLEQKLSQLKKEFAEGFVSGGGYGLQSVANEIRETQDKLNRLSEAQKRAGMSDQELVIYNYQVAQAERQKQIEFYKAALATGQAGKNTAKYRAELAKLEKEQGKNQKETKKSTGGFQKLFNSIKRIAVYRLIRTALRQITQSLTDTAQAFSSVDDSVNDTMSKVTSSLSVIKLSLGTFLMPIIQIIQPILDTLATGFANLANTISQAMSTTGKYTAINADAIKDYRGELEKTNSTLLDFDKFRVLDQGGQQNAYSAFLLPDQEVEKNNENVNKVKAAIESIGDIISKVFNIIQKVGAPILKIVETALPIVLEVIDSVVTSISNLVGWLDKMGLLEPMIYAIIAGLTALGASKIIKGIKNLTSSFNGLGIAIGAVTLAVSIISNWDNFSKEAKTAITVVSSLIAVFTGLAVAIMAVQGSLTLGAAIALITTSVAAGAVAIKGMVSAAKGFADGGLPEKGTMFYAGEAGAEVVYNMDSGQSGVANVKQLKAAFYQALVEYGNTQRGSSEQPIIVNLDGNQIYNSIQKNSKRRANNSGIYL